MWPSIKLSHCCNTSYNCITQNISVCKYAINIPRVYSLKTQEWTLGRLHQLCICIYCMPIRVRSIGLLSIQVFWDSDWLEQDSIKVHKRRCVMSWSSSVSVKQWYVQELWGYQLTNFTQFPMVYQWPNAYSHMLQRKMFESFQFWVHNELWIQIRFYHSCDHIVCYWCKSSYSNYLADDQMTLKGTEYTIQSCSEMNAVHFGPSWVRTTSLSLLSLSCATFIQLVLAFFVPRSPSPV